MQCLCEAYRFHEFGPLLLRKIVCHLSETTKGLWNVIRFEICSLFAFERFVWVWFDWNKLHNIDPYGSGFDLFVGKTFPYGLARLFLSLHVIALLRCWDSITRAGLYIKLASVWLRSTDRWPSLLGFPHTLLYGYTHSLILCEQSPYLANLCRDLSSHKTLTVFTGLACRVGARSWLWTVVHVTLKATCRNHKGSVARLLTD